MALTQIERHRIILTAAASASTRARSNTMRLRVRVEGVAYDVDVEILADHEVTPTEIEPEDQIPDSVLQPPLPQDLRDEDRICHTPIAGAIVKVLAKPGRFLRRDDPVVIIEAMKMQTAIGAPVDGVVEEIGVAVGDAVKPGQMLCRQA